MELLDKLEERIASLLRELDMVKGENLRLKESSQQELSRFMAENEALKQELGQERQKAEEVVQRLDALLVRISDTTSEN